MPEQTFASELKKNVKNCTFKVIANPLKQWAVKLGREIEDLLGADRLVPGNEDVCILIGGDGTIFHNKGSVHGAIFAIGGKQSQVCQANQENWGEMLALVMKGFKIDERVALNVKVNERDEGWAINDAVVHSRRHNFLKLALAVGNSNYSFGGDGVIVATPTGATGYAYSAGGYIIGKVPGLMEVVPICPYMRALRPMLVPALSRVKIASEEGNADLIIDGQTIIELGSSDVVSVNGERRVKFVELPSKNKKITAVRL
ncbi:MAG: NAD(+)/NADH kinase [Candidatus ainarchaeum sp.]|nr:NAD(+)/NADH kinase [Candidatus ainarchaeum sp.]